MSGAYAASVREHPPHAVLTFNRFHVVKLMNERLDDLRRELVRAAGCDSKQAIKGLRALHRRDDLEPDAAQLVTKARSNSSAHDETFQKKPFFLVLENDVKTSGC